MAVPLRPLSWHGSAGGGGRLRDLQDTFRRGTSTDTAFWDPPSFSCIYSGEEFLGWKGLVG